MSKCISFDVSLNVEYLGEMLDNQPELCYNNINDGQEVEIIIENNSKLISENT